MAVNDWAIVVGVWCYPGLDDLRGPENDAVAFANWLGKPDGGDVPPGPSQRPQIQLILSSDFHPPFGTVNAAQPTREGIERALDLLQEVAEENKQNNKGLRVGRRLYLYFAGHGFGPKLDESALLTANATPSRVRYHIAGRSWADWFHVANYFDEVVLFMDCCRNVFSNAPINAVGYGNIIGPRQGRRFYAFGTKWRRVTWERRWRRQGTWRVYHRSTCWTEWGSGRRRHWRGQRQNS